MNLTFKHILKITTSLIGLLLLFQIACTIYLFSTTYNDFILFILNKTGKLHKIDEFENSYLTISKFNFIRYFSFAITILYGAIIYFIVTHSNKILNSFYNAFSALINCVKRNIFKIISLQKHEKIILLSTLTFFVLYRLYQIIVLPISYDEAWTYMNFSSKNIIVSALYYPAPNNQILYSMITNVFLLLPIDDKIAIRLPNLLIGVIAALLIFIFLKDFFNKNTALMGFITFSSLFPVNLYSIQARGYMLIVLFSILITYAIFKIVFVRSRKIYWAVFIIASILGFYTIPTFLYPFVSVSFFAFIAFLYEKNYWLIKYLIYSGVIITIAVILLYLPPFYISGTDALFNNSNIQNVANNPEKINIKLNHLQSTANWLWGINIGGTLLMAIIIVISLVSIFFFKNYNNKLMMLFVFISLALPIIFVFIQNVVAYQRTWIHLTFILIIFLSLTLFQFISNKILSMPTKIFYLFLLPIFLLTNFNYLYHKICITDFLAENFTQQHLVDSSFKNIYINYDYYDTIITYILTVSHNSIIIDRHDAYDKNKPYDYLILKKSNQQFNPSLEDFILDYEDYYIKAYKKI